MSTFSTTAEKADGIRYTTPPCGLNGAVGAAVQHLQSMNKKLSAAWCLSADCIGRFNGMTNPKKILQRMIEYRFAAHCIVREISTVDEFKYFMHEHKSVVVTLNANEQTKSGCYQISDTSSTGELQHFVACYYDQSYVIVQDPRSEAIGARGFRLISWPVFQMLFSSALCLDIDDR